jgi:ABC-type transport system substrate-binding protein
MGKMKLMSIGGAMVLLSLVCFSTAVATPMTTNVWASEFTPHGGYIDELVFVVYTTTEIPQAMLALQAGTIDAYDERVLSSYLPGLVSNPDIEVKVSLGSMYRVLVLNSQKFPINITGFRRAMAFGMNKYQINTEAVGGAGVPLDSYVPVIATEWAVEDELPTRFYDKDIVSGNASLEAAGFIDFDDDGYREYDANGNGVWDAGVDLEDTDPLLQVELWPTLEYGPAIAATTVTANGMEEMGLHASVVEKDWNTLVNAIEAGEHWVACWTENLPVVNPPKVLYDYFRTGTPDNVLYYRFSNATIDAKLDQMNAATTQEDVKTFSREATMMLAYEQPLIVCYNDANIDAYRTDEFTGFFNFAGRGITNGNNPYVATEVKKADGTLGGVFRYCLSEKLDTTSVILVSTGYEATVMQYVYESLWNIDPNTWDPIPGLAYEWDIEQTTAGVGGAWVQDGQKFSFTLYDNATWHDGTPLTSEDVKYSFDTVWPQSPQRPDEMDDIYNVTAPDAYTVELWVNKTGYFEWAAATNGVSIVPKHIWQQGEADFTTWIPDGQNNTEMVGSGPFKWNEYVPGEYISMLRYEDWRWDIRDVPAPPEETTTTTTEAGETTTTTEDDANFSTVSIIAGLGFAVAIFYKRRRR